MQADQRRTKNLALAFQEVLTVVERLRAGRQMVTDAGAFRAQIRQALEMAKQEARRLGYNDGEIALTDFAVVAFLDESILNARNPVFADWPRQPLQEERYGHHNAGEEFFRNLQRLLGQNDSQALADVIEVYHLCLLLGYLGRYSAGGRGDLRAAVEAVGARIRRIRGASVDLCPSWKLPQEPPRRTGGDPWVRRLVYAAAAGLLITVALYAGFRLALSSGASSLQEMAQQRGN